MRIKIKHSERVIHETEVDVTFPLYQKNIFDFSISYIKRISPTEKIDIDVRDDGLISIELSKDDMTKDTSPLDYQLGTGEYSLDAAEFNEIFEKAKSSFLQFE